MKVCKDGRIWGQNNKLAATHLGILKRKEYIKRGRKRGNPNWKPFGDGNGEHLQRGYKLIMLKPNDFFYPMANNHGYVRENRLVMAKYLGRNLHSWEIVHHLNNIKTDNRIENLKLCLADGHNTITGMQNKIDALLRENQRLKEEVAKLKK